MSVLTLYVDEVMRTLSNDGQYPFVVNDKTVDIVRFALNTGFTDVVLDENTALRVMYQRPGETQVRAQTLTHYDTDGIHNFYDWELLSADLAKKGTITCALCILRADSEVEEWHTTPCQIRVLDTIHTDDSDEGDETITPTVAQRVAVLETMIQRVASGAPVVVGSVSDMTDTAQIYVLSTDGNWYYHNGSAWVSGGAYGAVATDTTLTQSGIPADAKAVGDEIALITDEAELFPYIIVDGRDLLYNGNVVTGDNNIWRYRDLPKRVHIVGSSALSSNRAVVWIVNGSTMISAPIRGTNESIDQWIEIPDNATGIWISNPATPTVSAKAKSAKDLVSRQVEDRVNLTTEESPLSYYGVISGRLMTVNGTLSNYASANVWKYKDLPSRVHVTGSSSLSGSFAVMWWVAEGSMVSAPIQGSHSVIDTWFDVPEGVEELWLYDRQGNNQLSAMTAVDIVSREKTSELEEAVAGAVSIGSQWAGKNWFAYGTSITGGSKMKFPPYLAQMSGLLLNNKGIAGEGIGNLGASSTGEVYDAICNITDGKLAADLITLETGANDVNDDVPLGTIYDTGRSTLSGCLNDCIRYLQTNTDAQIVVTVSPATKTIPSASGKYYEWAEMVEKICKINRVHFVNGDNGMGYAKLSSAKGSTYVIDTIHQTDLGGYIMAQNIWYQLRNIPLFYTQMP